MLNYSFNSITSDEFINKNIYKPSEESAYIERTKSLIKPREKSEIIKTLDDINEENINKSNSIIKYEQKEDNHFLKRMKVARDHRNNQIDHHLDEYNIKEIQNNLIPINSTYLNSNNININNDNDDDNIVRIQVVEPNRKFSSGFANDLYRCESKYIPSFSPDRLLSPPTSPPAYYLIYLIDQ